MEIGIDDKSSKFAGTLIEGIKNILQQLGVSHGRLDEWEEFIYVVLIIVVAFALAWIMRFIIHYTISRLLSRSHNAVLKILVDRKIFSRIANLIPPLVIISLLPLAFENSPHLLSIIERICWIYLIIAFVMYTNMFLTTLWHILSRSDTMRDRPLKGLLQVTKGIIVGLAVIGIVSLLINKSPMNLITGLGAFAAVLMLVFKDSILGFVAGVQLAENDMIREGDWIVMGDMVNGVVIDITLNTVKVQNFDNTIITIPPYSLISGAFQNWRGMAESGGRRIMRSYTIDINSIKFCTPEMLEDYKKIDYLNDYITRKQEQQQAGKIANTENPAGLVNGTIETNLGVFRAYMTMYLQNHPFINNDLTLMVRILEADANGVPLQIYCFSANKVWVSYESIQAEIMEHFVSVMPKFGLHAFQNASGRDYISQAYITAGKQPLS
ncbi:mechanosensitive ion channel family protein [Coprobacter tertius]|uniref:Mechanosensitive ion channel family protein n=1 Tax=Coprobacter tertius TaxID=2944915 RepID=A0ABT1MIK8_9BACT|nr:mechanosensitive ion channel domain-containing protein [Coprobacter tertius]MCP9612463.1 mechanosensitive ion channel family protein [Coprobacter tertius]